MRSFIVRSAFVFILNTCMPVHAAGDSGARTIKVIHIESSNFISIEAVGTPWLNPDGCGSSTSVLIPFSDPAEKQILALVMEAFALGRSASFWLVGCQQTPWGYTLPIAVTAGIF